MLIDLFHGVLPSVPKDDDFAAIAYCLGRIQGEHMAAEKYAREQEGAAV